MSLVIQRVTHIVMSSVSQRCNDIYRYSVASCELIITLSCDVHRCSLCVFCQYIQVPVEQLVRLGNALGQYIWVSVEQLVHLRLDIEVFVFRSCVHRPWVCHDPFWHWSYARGFAQAVCKSRYRELICILTLCTVGIEHSYLVVGTLFVHRSSQRIDLVSTVLALCHLIRQQIVSTFGRYYAMQVPAKVQAYHALLGTRCISRRFGVVQQVGNIVDIQRGVETALLVYIVKQSASFLVEERLQPTINTKCAVSQCVCVYVIGASAARVALSFLLFFCC